MTNERNERMEAMLESVYESDTADGFSERVMRRIANDPVESVSADRTWLRSWKSVGLIAASCTAVIVGVCFLYPRVGNNKTQLTDARSNSNSAAESYNGPVILKLPSSGEAAERIAKSDWLPRDFVLLTGRFANPQEDGDQRTVELRVDRVIKGDAGNGRIIAKDELPAFCCRGPVVASNVYSVGQPILCWLTREQRKWNLVEINLLTPELTKLLDAVTGDNQAELLRPLITPTGLDHQTTEMIKLVASAEQVTPVLKEIIRKTPELLEPVKGASGPSNDADWQQQMGLVSYRLSPAIDILCRFSDYKDTEIVDLILPCYPPLEGKGGDSFRLYLNYYMKGLCGAARMESGKSRLGPKQIETIRAVMLAEIEGANRKKTPVTNSACDVLGILADSKTVTALLQKLKERPIDPLHESIVGALFNIVWGGKATEADAQRIREAWIAELKSLDRENSVADESAKELTESFANKIAGSLYQVNITVPQRRALRGLHSQTKLDWMRKVVTRFARAEIPEPPDAAPDSQANVSVSDGTLIVNFTKDAGPDDAIVERLEQWDGPTEVRLVRSSRVLEILAAIDEANVDHMRISYSPMTHDVLVAIGELRSLRSLVSYSGGPCDPREFRELDRLWKLKSLEIVATPLVEGDREGITWLGRLRALEKLVLADVGPVTDWHLGRIHHFKTLTTVGIDLQYVTSDGFERWVATLPKLNQITLPRILIRMSLTDVLRKRNIKILPPLVEGSLRIWNTTDGTQMYAGQMIGDVDFMANGSLLAVEDGDAIKVYDFNDGRLVRSFESMLQNHERGFAANRDSLYWRDKKQIVLADSIGNRSVLNAFASEGRGVPFQILSSGKSMAVSSGKSIRILDIATGKLQSELKPSGFFGPSQIALSSDGQYLAASGSSPGVRIWSLKSGKELHAHPSHNVLVGFTGNSKTLLCLQNRTELFAMDVVTGKSKRVLTCPANSQPLFHAVNADRFAYASSGKPIIVDLYDTNTWKRLRQFQFAGAESHFISAVTLSIDGKFLAASGNLNHRAD